MRLLRNLLTLAALIAIPASLSAQRSLRFSVTAGPYRVDRLAGTPLVPSLGLTKPLGERALFGTTLGWIRDAGFYGLDALTLDVDVGLRSRPAPLEWFAAVGPSGILGGDGDGTPYTQVGGHATLGATWWIGSRVGLVASTTGRAWFTTGNGTFSPSASIGIVFRR